MYYVYILQSRQDGKLYIGYTADLRSRFREHNQGLSQATRHRQPFDLVYYEAFKAKKDAVVRERMIKQYKQGYTNLKKRFWQLKILLWFGKKLASRI